MKSRILQSERNAKRVKYACYISNVTMAAVVSLSPLLFLTFKEMYDISFTLLGLLVAINFATQLLIDLLFSLFSHRLNIPALIRTMPILAVVGFNVYALAPFVFSGSQVYIGLVIGTIIFSAASGLAEVLLSPIFAELPSDNPDRDMSKLHSIYAWGVGDGLAALVGKRYGKHKIKWKMADGKKSVEGSFAMFLCSLVSVYVVLLVRGGIGVPMCLVIALLVSIVSTIAELCAKDGWDTVICPVSAMLVIIPMVTLF